MPDGITKVGLVVKMGSFEAITLGGDVAEWLKTKGVKVYGDAELAKMIDAVEAVPRQALADTIDALVVLGGDGTILYTARLAQGKKVPILGVNMGGLGFLTAIKVEEVFRNLERVIKGEYDLEERMMLSVNVLRGEKTFSYQVLNDAVMKSTIARLCNLECKVSGEYVTTYRSDGLIVSTPTGSTGYALSAGGPILYPIIHSIIIVPICPFNLTNRPIVVPENAEITVGIGEGNSNVELTLDGQIDVPLSPGDLISVKRSESSIYLIKCEGKGYFDILRERLLWEVGKKS